MSFVDINLDLQISICTFLHPSDILTLRKTCKTLQLVTRQRTIWVDALRRVCLENMLFLPSFPILDMSDVELERAAMAPRRWIELSTSYAARRVSDSEVRLSPTTTRIIDPCPSKGTPYLILVPGGRYMVALSVSGIGVWDLGYTSSADCKLIASVGIEGGCFSGKVHATPDGMGLVIFSLHLNDDCSFYEIYPQSDTPQLTKIAGLNFPPRNNLLIDVSPGKTIWYEPLPHIRQITFRVWDYRLNASVSFLALGDVGNIACAKVVATQKTIVTLQQDDIFIWAIPPLLPQPPNFDDYSLTQFTPAIRIKVPDGLSFRGHPFVRWRTVSSWYFDPSKPLYFAKIYPRRSQQCFKLIIEPDFSDATLHLIDTIQLATPDDYEWETPLQTKLCEETLVYKWNFPGPYKRSRGLSICPASGRFVHLDIWRYNGRGTGKIMVFDFLPHWRL